MADGRTRPGKAIGVIERLGQPEGVLPMPPPLRKRTELREAPGQVHTGVHGLYERGPKVLPEWRVVQGLDVPAVHLRRPLIIQPHSLPPSLRIGPSTHLNLEPRARGAATVLARLVLGDVALEAAREDLRPRIEAIRRQAPRGKHKVSAVNDVHEMHSPSR